jgi:hypothetical protein
MALVHLEARYSSHVCWWLSACSVEQILIFIAFAVILIILDKAAMKIFVSFLGVCFPILMLLLICNEVYDFSEYYICKFTHLVTCKLVHSFLEWPLCFMEFVFSMV